MRKLTTSEWQPGLQDLVPAKILPECDILPVPEPPEPLSAFETELAGGLIRFRIAYPAVQQLRAPGAAPERTGMLLGSRSPEGVEINDCEAFPPAAGKASDDSTGLRQAINRFRRGESVGSPEFGGSLLGIFRIQDGSWAESSQADSRLIQAFLDQLQLPQCLFLLVRKFDYRPWAATLFIADVAGAVTPVLEFPCDEYLLVNGYVGDLAPPATAEPSPAARKGGGKAFWGTVAATAVAAAALAAAGTYVWSARKSPADTGAPSPGRFGLEVRRKGDDFEISWNRVLDSMRTASTGMLSIHDGLLTKNLPLSTAQLGEGTMLYSPMSNDVDVRLEIEGSDRRVQAESVHVFGWSPAPLVPAAPPVGTRSYVPPPLYSQPPQVYTAPMNATPVKNVQAVAAVTPPPSAWTVPQPAPAKVTQAPVPATLPARRPVNIEAARVMVPEPPPAPVASANPIGLMSAPALPRVPAPPAAEVSHLPEVKSGGKFEEGKLLKQVRPVYPPLAQAAHVRGMVRFLVTIGKDGRVRDLQLLNGSPMLIPSAGNALAQWIYAPALLNGEPVEVTKQVDVDFTLR